MGRRLKYARWAHLYDAFYERAMGKNYAGEAAYIAAIIEKNHGPHASVLDVACGTGLHLSYMPETFTLAGVDEQPMFLEIAKRRVPRATFTCGLMQELSVDRKFDAVTCMFSAIGHLPDVANLRETCRRFAAALNPGGTVIIEPWIRPETVKPGILQMLTIDDEDLKAARTSSGTRKGDKTYLHFAFAISDKDGTRAFEETFTLTLFTDDEYEEALESAGFDVTREAPELIPRGLFIGRSSLGTGKHGSARNEAAGKGV